MKRKIKLNTYVITECPSVIRGYKVSGQNEKEAWRNFYDDKIIKALPDDFGINDWQEISIHKLQERDQ